MIATEPTPKAKLEALLHFIYTGLYSQQMRLLSCMYNAVDLKRMIVEKGGSVRELWERLVSLVTQLLEEGKAQGDFDSSLPTKIMVLSFFSVFSPKVYDHLLLGDDYSREEQIKQFQHVYFHGIMKHEEKEEGFLL